MRENTVLSRLGISWDVIGRIADGILPRKASRILAMIKSARDEFMKLERVLVSELEAEVRKNALLLMSFRAAQAINVLFRNLYERSADIGFLSQDADIRAFVMGGGAGDQRSLVRRRLSEYTQKYSVYRDVVVFSPDGRILARLDDTEPGPLSAAPFLSRALHSDTYVEAFGQFDFLSGARNLVYAQAIVDEAGRAVGILALVFRFENEMEGIFRDLGAVGMTYICLSDASGRILAASDEEFLVPGRSIPLVHEPEGRIVAFMGRKFFLVSHRGEAYQSYHGPDWYGHAMIPMEYMDETDAIDVQSATQGNVLAYIDALCPSLRGILDTAAHINTALRIVVWNGSVEALKERDGSQEPLKAILGQIQDAGAETAQAFSDAIGQLISMEVASYLRTATDLARLAGNIMDRNLYERSDDCRWWALNSEIRAILSQTSVNDEAQNRLETLLAGINALYTVYTRLFVFDRAGRVLAASNLHADSISLKGETLSEAWIQTVLACRHTAQYVVSPFEPTHLYGGYPSYIYAAAVRAVANEDETVGGIGIVFDAGPEFQRMLDGCLPASAGAYALYVEQGSRRIIAASSGSQHKIGEHVSVDDAFLNLLPGQSHAALTTYRGQYCIAAAVASSGYREYKTTGDYVNPVISLVVLPVGNRASTMTRESQGPLYEVGSVTTEPAHSATFFVAGELFAVPAGLVCEVITAEGITAPLAHAREMIAGTVVYRDSTSGGDSLPIPLTVLDAAHLFRQPSGKSTGNHIIVLRVHKKLLGLLVDAVDAVPSFDASRIGRANLLPATHYGVSHAAIMPTAEGRPVILIFDEEALLRLVESPAPSSAARP